MAARSPPSPLPPPPERRLGPWSPRVGRGAVVHTVSCEATGLAGGAREGVVDKSDISLRGEEGSGGRRGPGRAAPAQAPLLSAPAGSRRLEGISVEEAMVTRTQLLEDELSSLKEELALCQVSRTLGAGLPPAAGPGPAGTCAPLPLPSAASLRGLGTHPVPPGGPPSRLPQPARPAARGWRDAAATPPGLPPLSGRRPGRDRLGALALV